MKKIYIIIAAAVISGGGRGISVRQKPQSAKITVATDARCLSRRTEGKVSAFLNRVRSFFGRVHGNDVKGSGDLSHPLDNKAKNPLRYFEYPRDFFAVTVCHVISANK